MMGQVFNIKANGATANLTIGLTLCQGIGFASGFTSALSPIA